MSDTKRSAWEYVVGLAVAIVFWLWILPSESEQEARLKAFEKRSSKQNLFCNPASGACHDDPGGKKREAWEDALTSAAK